MRLLVAGATGQLGSGLVEVLPDRGASIVPIARRPAKSARRLARLGPPGSTVGEPVEGDVRRPLWGLADDVIERLAGEVDVVLNLAGETNWAAAGRDLHAANVLGPLNGFDVARRLRALGGRCAAYVHASSVHVAGGMTGLIPESPFGPDGARTPYEQSKWLAEQALLERAAGSVDDPPLVIARIGGLVGNSVTGRTARRNSLYILPTLWDRVPGRLLYFAAGGRVDMLPRDEAARLVLDLARAACEGRVAGAELVHVCAGEDAPAFHALLSAVRSQRIREPDAMPRVIHGSAARMSWTIDTLLRVQRPPAEWANALVGLRYIGIDRLFERARLAALVDAPLPAPPLELLARLVFGEPRAAAAPREASPWSDDGAFARFAG